MTIRTRLTLRLLAFVLATLGSTALLVAAGLNEPNARDAAPAPARLGALLK